MIKRNYMKTVSLDMVCQATFDVTLVGDGHSTLGNGVINEEQIIKHHNTTLHGHYNVEHFSVVRNSMEDLFHPLHDSFR